MHRKTRSSRRFLVVLGCIALSGLALLIWGRLKVVAGVPRTALAEPQRSAAHATIPPR